MSMLKMEEAWFSEYTPPEMYTFDPGGATDTTHDIDLLCLRERFHIKRLQLKV